MKKFTFFLALNLFVYSAFATDYYLSDDGNDGNNGTSIATPWKTLQKLSSELGGPSGTWGILFNSGDRIFFRKGDTFRGTIAFSAWNNHGITFDSYGTGEMPIIKGSSVITNWTIHSGNIWKAIVPQTVHFLYVNNLKQTLARTPNTGTWNISASTATSISNSNISSSGENFVGSNICLREFDWRLNRQIITSQSGTNVTWTNSINAAGTNANFYFDNKLEHLDANNEWFYDTAMQTLYLMSVADPNTLFVEGSTNMVGIAGNDNRTANVIKNLQFEHYADAGITLKGGSHNNQILNCRFINNCTSLHLSGDNATITNNHIENVSVQGMLLANLKDSNVMFNTITNVGLEFGNHRPGFVGDFYSSGIWLINAFNGGTVLAENSITNCGYNGIRYNGIGIMIEKNDIRNTLLNMDDGGAIYTFGSDSYNNTIQNNYIKNVVGDHNGTVPGGIVNGIYIDNLSHSNVIRNNTLEDIGVGSGILINADSHSNTIQGNVTYKCREGITFADWRPGLSIYNNSLLNNTFYANLQNSTPVLILSDDNNYNVFSNSNTNFLCNPYSNTVVKYMWSSNQTFTLAQWQTQSGFDAASVGSFYNWTFPVDHSFIVSNLSNSTITTPLINTIDLNNNPITSATLQPYTSRVLIKTPSICFPSGATGVALQSSLGISTLDRGADSNWITTKKNGYLVLESKTKGLVIPIMSNPETTIIPATGGMIVYDSDDFVIKLYNGTTWISIVQSCN